MLVWMDGSFDSGFFDKLRLLLPTILKDITIAAPLSTSAQWNSFLNTVRVSAAALMSAFPCLLVPDL
jgi:hypothetical protein